jgi:hypothetical protein
MKSILLIIICCVTLNAFGQKDTLTAFEKYSKSDDFKQLQKRVRDKEIEDSINDIPNVEAKSRTAAYLKECDIQNKKTEAWLKKSQSDNNDYDKRMERKYGKPAVAKVSKGQVWVGITDELCLYGLTEPNSRKTTYTKEGKTDIWIYQGQANGCVGSGCPDLDYIITFRNHKAIAITTGD